MQCKVVTSYIMAQMLGLFAGVGTEGSMQFVQITYISKQFQF